MIIKSMSRKTQSFGQLIAYMNDIEKSEQRYNIYQNLYGRKADDIEEEFQTNAEHVDQRRNGVYLYHEILSISRAEKLETQTQKEILRDIAYEYAQKRAEHCLVFGTLHDDHAEHLHYHFLISSNALEESKKMRLTKAQFDQLKKGMEAKILESYPELEQKVVINRQADEKLSNKGYERKRRTGNTPQRDHVKDKLHDIFSTSRSKQDFFSRMIHENFEMYVRGNTMGVTDHSSGRKHRLKTLGLSEDFKKLSNRIGLDGTAESENRKNTKSKRDAPNNDKATEQKPKSKTSESTPEDTASKNRAEMKKWRETQKPQHQTDSKPEHKGGKTR